MGSTAAAALSIAFGMVLVPSVANAQRPGGARSGPEFADGVVQIVLDIARYSPYGKALAAQVEAGDGGGIDGTFRNSGHDSVEGRD